MVHKKRSILSAQEIEALLGSDNESSRTVDRLFPYRMLFIGLLTFLGGTTLLTAPHIVAASLFDEPAVVAQYTGVFYLRGWLILGLLAIGIYSYTYGRYTNIVLFTIAVVGTSNLVTDLLEIYPVRFSDPSIEFTISLLLRFVAWLFTVANVLRCSQLPPMGERWHFRLRSEAINVN
jgi:hypothetical protein